MADNGDDSCDPGPPGDMMADDVGDVLTEGLEGDLVEELDYEEEDPVNSADITLQEEKACQDSQVTGDEAAEDVSKLADHKTGADQSSATADNDAATSAAEDDQVERDDPQQQINTNGVVGETDGDTSAAAVTSDSKSAEVDTTPEDPGSGSCLLPAHSEHKSGDSAAGHHDCTGSDKEISSELVPRPKKPIKKITMEGFEDDSKVGMIDGVDNPETDKSCVLCNMVFSSNKHLNYHRQHRDHSYVVKGKCPSSGRYQCLLCWKGFSREEYLKEHIDKKEHIDRSKDKGMIGFYSPPAKFAVMRESEKVWLREKELDRDRRERLLKQADRRDRGLKTVNFNNYFEIDSIGECDTSGVVLRKLNRSRSKSKSNRNSTQSRRSSDKKSSSRRSSSKTKDSTRRSERSRSPHVSNKVENDKSPKQSADIEETKSSATDSKELDTAEETMVDDNFMEEEGDEEPEIPGEETCYEQQNTEQTQNDTEEKEIEDSTENEANDAEAKDNEMEVNMAEEEDEIAQEESEIGKDEDEADVEGGNEEDMTSNDAVEDCQSEDLQNHEDDVPMDTELNENNDS